MTANTEDLMQRSVDASQQPEDSDLGPIAPDENVLMVGEYRARVKRLKSREILGLVQLLTRGLGDGIRNLDLSTDDPEALKGDLAAIAIIALPNVIDDTFVFLRSIVEPVNPDENRKLQEAMFNPEIDVLLDMVEIILVQEVDDLYALVGKVGGLMARSEKLFAGRKQPKTDG